MGNGTSIGRVRGLGSAKSGAHHWLLQRFTAIGNLLLVLWLVVSILMLPNLHYASVIEWIVKPVPATAMALLVISTFWHARLGLQVVVEDYVHEHANKFACIAALNLAAFGGAAFGVFCIIRLALGAHA
ncbi:succinate dehydrogenase, hydrophobic membrane anchor protein [Novosphingobium colocasiae]|uniref:Succinate dehydrogenase hydrophobic membrane anchor subunit n=1 Tax=Novosphingobium colocasiae TaxID=1256513 RepID=A0A918PHQ9_9SPHN|nr:succinate dehydrogenase, hydrophobic membrane anchor protein [Novosphingobium colocasiae]GGZ08217.1 succinate dehydrogenase, hydrophobic membrane anchor protein [Novosphingobium colocasiae]